MKIVTAAELRETQNKITDNLLKEIEKALYSAAEAGANTCKFNLPANITAERVSVLRQVLLAYGYQVIRSTGGGRGAEPWNWDYLDITW